MRWVLLSVAFLVFSGYAADRKCPLKQKPLNIFAVMRLNGTECLYINYIAACGDEADKRERCQELDLAIACTRIKSGKVRWQDWNEHKRCIRELPEALHAYAKARWATLVAHQQLARCHLLT